MRKGLCVFMGLAVAAAAGAGSAQAPVTPAAAKAAGCETAVNQLNQLQADERAAQVIITRAVPFNADPATYKAFLFRWQYLDARRKCDGLPAAAGVAASAARDRLGKVIRTNPALCGNLSEQVISSANIGAKAMAAKASTATVSAHEARVFDATYELYLDLASLCPRTDNSPAERAVSAYDAALQSAAARLSGNDADLRKAVTALDGRITDIASYRTEQDRVYLCRKLGEEADLLNADFRHYRAALAPLHPAIRDARAACASPVAYQAWKTKRASIQTCRAVLQQHLPALQSNGPKLQAGDRSVCSAIAPAVTAVRQACAADEEVNRTFGAGLAGVEKACGR